MTQNILEIGNTVVHPAHGFCKIIGIIQDSSSGKGQGEMSFELKPKKNVSGNFRIIIPVKAMKRSGVRSPVTKTELDKVLRKLKYNEKEDDEETIDYFKNQKKLKKGDLNKVAEVIRSLEKYEYQLLLSKDQKTLDLAREILAREIAYVKKISKTKANKIIDKNLNRKGG